MEIDDKIKDEKQNMIIIIIKKQQKYQQHPLEKLINMNLLQVKK